MPPSPSATARTLQQLLEAEGAVFHKGMAARAVPSMGGGVGVVVTAPAGLRSGTVLATLPFRSMITTKKARLNLAMAEVATASRAPSGFTVPFTAHVWEAEEIAASQSLWGTTLHHAVFSKVAELEEKLSPTDTITCYLLLLARLYGRWTSAQVVEAGEAALPAVSSPSPITAASAPSPSGAEPVRLHFTHENAWMRTWMLALPDQYDNLLELLPTSASPSEVSESRSVASTAFVAQCTPFARQQLKVQQEQRALLDRFNYCRSVLGCLTCPLVGVEQTAETTTTPSTTTSAAASSAPCELTMTHFRWASNTLMTRGFAFEEDIWAMMPWVDYFNYALSANGSMTWRTTTTMAGTSTGRRRVQRSWTAVAQAPNAYEYTFELVQPVQGGTQVLLHYGAYSDFELLQWYGFRLGDTSLLPTSLMQAACPPAELSQTSLDNLSYLFNPLLHDDAGDSDGLLRSTAPTVADDEATDIATPITAHVRSEALHRQSVLTRFLPVLLREATRVRAFDVFWAAQTAQHRLDAAAVCGQNAEEEEEAAETEDDAEAEAARKVLAYESWCQATQRACSHALSPYADTDGHYPVIPPNGETWLHALFRSLRDTPPPNHTDARPSATQARASALDGWSRTLAALLLDGAVGVDDEFLACARQGCFLGPLGRSQQLAGALDSLASVLLKHPQCWDLLPPEAVKDRRWPRKAHLHRQLVRAVAWAELSVNWVGGAAAATPDTCEPPLLASCVSVAVAKMTFSAACDAWTLLHVLALEATDEMLDEYVAYEDAYYR